MSENRSSGIPFFKTVIAGLIATVIGGLCVYYLTKEDGDPSHREVSAYLLNYERDWIKFKYPSFIDGGVKFSEYFAPDPFNLIVSFLVGTEYVAGDFERTFENTKTFKQFLNGLNTNVLLKGKSSIFLYNSFTVRGINETKKAKRRLFSLPRSNSDSDKSYIKILEKKISPQKNNQDLAIFEIKEDLGLIANFLIFLGFAENTYYQIFLTETTKNSGLFATAVISKQDWENHGQLLKKAFDNIIWSPTRFEAMANRKLKNLKNNTGTKD